jgi:hypothetical protein
MRTSGAIGAMILAIAIYFALFWGFDALRILTSPTYGLEDVWRSQVVFGIGRYAGFNPEGLIRLAAALGALKLAVAGVCIVHVVDRVRALVTGSDPANEILETGLLLAVGINIAAVVPAIWSQNGDLVRELTIQLVLAGLAGGLCIVDRSGRKTAPIEVDAAKSAPALAGETSSFTPWRR